MFTLKCSDFVERSMFADYKVYYMNGLTVAKVANANVIVNVDAKTAYVYSE